MLGPSSLVLTEPQTSHLGFTSESYRDAIVRAQFEPRRRRADRELAERAIARWGGVAPSRVDSATVEQVGRVQRALEVVRRSLDPTAVDPDD